MVLVDKPIEDMLSVIVMCMQHTANISLVVTLICMAGGFLIRIVSLTACAIQNWMCLSFYAAVGKLPRLANPWIHSTAHLVSYQL